MWMAPSLLQVLVDWDVELIKTPMDLLVYCAICHFVDDLPMCISRQQINEIFEKFILVEDAISYAEVRFFDFSHLIQTTWNISSLSKFISSVTTFDVASVVGISFGDTSARLVAEQD